MVDAKTGHREAARLTPEALRALLTWSGGPDEHVFRAAPGHRRRVAFVFSTAVDLCGFNEGVTDRRLRVVFHTLRHTFASWLAQRGVDLYVIQQLLRHRSPQMTQRYAHLRPDAVRASLDVVRSVVLPDVPTLATH
jgi:integrase